MNTRVVFLLVVVLVTAAAPNDTWPWPDQAFQKPEEQSGPRPKTAGPPSVEGLEQFETAAFIFYFPSGFEPTPERGEVSYRNKRGESISVKPRGHPPGGTLDEDLCNETARTLFSRSAREKVHASEAQDVTFKVEGGIRSCYYRYQLGTGDLRAHLEQKFYQGGNSPAYLVTAVYRENSPNQVALQKALQAFTIKGTAPFARGSSKISADPHLVIVDKSERAYTVFRAVPRDLPDAELERLRSKVAQQKSMELVPWDEFLEKKKEFLKSRILKDEYPGSKATEGIVELLRQSPGIPWGLTWNGGIALTRLDYQHAKETYERYKDDLEEYERTRNRDPRRDPVNPKGHLGPLLGW